MKNRIIEEARVEQGHASNDPNNVERPIGLDTKTLYGLVDRIVRQYRAHGEVTPAGWDEFWLDPGNLIDGVATLLESQLQFGCRTVLVDNWSSNWLYIDTIRRYVPPYCGGVVLNCGGR